MANTTTKTYQDGDPLLEDDLDNLYENLQPAVENLALATTGTSAGDLLASAGSNLPPAFVSPDVVAAAMTSTGANAIFADVTASPAGPANTVGLAMTASGANNVVSVASSQSVPLSGFANNLIAAVTATTSAASNVIADGVVRTPGSAAGHLGIAVSAVSGTKVTSLSSFVNTSLNASLVTSGRPVRVQLVPSSTVSGGGGIVGVQLGVSDVSGYAEFALGIASTTTLVGVFGMQIRGSSSSPDWLSHMPCASISLVDFPAAGTWTYTLYMRGDGVSSIARLSDVRLIAHEL